jgi:hypothetical protein
MKILEIYHKDYIHLYCYCKIEGYFEGFSGVFCQDIVRIGA